MSDSASGMPTTAMLISYLDSLAGVFKAQRSMFDSLLTAQQNVRGVIEGIGHARIEADCKIHADQKVQAGRYENYWKSTDFGLVQDLQNIITANMPSGWSFGSLLPLNGWLTRINGNGVTSAITPANPIVLTAATTNGGALTGPVASGSAPYVVYTHVTSNDMYESLPSAESTRVALVGGNNSYTGTITGTVPTGVTKINIYRGINSGASGTEYLNQTIAVTAGAAYPAITIQKPDSSLNTTIIPPSWMSCPMTPEFAYIYALATATASTNKNSDVAPYQLISQGMLSPSNVLLAPSNGWLGIGNPATSGIFGTRDLTGAYVAGAIQTSNVAANNTQGYYGATKLVCRASTQLNGSYHPTISYAYYDATHSVTPQTATSITPTSDFVGSITNETVEFTITAGRVVLSVSQTAQSGTATTGNIVYEGKFPRTY